MYKEYLKQVAHKGQPDWDLDFINRKVMFAYILLVILDMILL